MACFLLLMYMATHTPIDNTKLSVWYYAVKWASWYQWMDSLTLDQTVAEESK
jgi:hypothetical protein